MKMVKPIWSLLVLLMSDGEDQDQDQDQDDGRMMEGLMVRTRARSGRRAANTRIVSNADN